MYIYIYIHYVYSVSKSWVIVHIPLWMINRNPPASCIKQPPKHLQKQMNDLEKHMN